MTFFTMDELIAAHKAQGQHFFDRDTMRFFSSRISRRQRVRLGHVFVSSERMDYHPPRDYTIRVAMPGGRSIRTLNVQPFASLSGATKFANSLTDIEFTPDSDVVFGRSEERRVGKE